MKQGRSDRLTPAQQSDVEALTALSDDQIDMRDIPEVRDWRGARRSLFFRPIKQQLTLRIDADVIVWFKHHTPDGEGYQTRINMPASASRSSQVDSAVTIAVYLRNGHLDVHFASPVPVERHARVGGHPVPMPSPPGFPLSRE